MRLSSVFGRGALPASVSADRSGGRLRNARELRKSGRARPLATFVCTAAACSFAVPLLGQEVDTGVRVGEACEASSLADTRSVSGDVRDLLTQQPLPGVDVLLWSTRFANVALGTARSAVDGTFRFCGVPSIPGIEVHAEVSGMESLRVGVPEDEAAWSGSLYIEWSTAIDVQGQVLDAVTGDPIDGATVVVEGRGARSTTAADGAFRIAGQGAGRVVLNTTALGYAARVDTLITTSGDQLDVRILLGVEAFELAPITVTARSARSLEERASGSRFDVMTRARVDSLIPRVMGFGSLLRNAQFPGLIVTEQRAGNLCVSTLRTGYGGGGCNMVEVFLDGVRLFAPETVLASIEPSIVESIRFMSAVEASVRFVGPNVRNGVLLIETRHGEPGRRP